MKITGRVQGVGFRYRAQYAAGSVGVTGWVRNEWDGSVEMEVQGTAEQISRMLGMIRQGTYVEIDHIDAREISPEEDERGFHIR